MWWCELVGYLIVTIPVVLILLAIVWTPCCTKGGNVVRLQKENFIDLGKISKTVVDKFESAFFSPELSKVGVEAGIMKGEPLGAAPVIKDTNKDALPGALNITPDVCNGTTDKCTGTETVVGTPLPKTVEHPYGNVPIGNLNGNGMNDMGTEISKMAAEKGMQCKFVGNAGSCPKGYSAMGANFGISGAKLRCNMSSMEKPATAVASVRNGEISRITVVDNGSGYEEAPNVEIKGGGGQGAKAVAFIDDSGSIRVVEILSGGAGYKSTPEVSFAVAEESDSCQLCCKSSF